MRRRVNEQLINNSAGVFGLLVHSLVEKPSLPALNQIILRCDCFSTTFSTFKFSSLVLHECLPLPSDKMPRIRPNLFCFIVHAAVSRPGLGKEYLNACQHLLDVRLDQA